MTSPAATAEPGAPRAAGPETALVTGGGAAEPEVKATSGAAAGPTGRTGPRLSPSRAADYKQCPLLFRFRVVDRIEEAPSDAAVRGTVVHSALERLFDLPAPQRTAEAAVDLLGPSLAQLREDDPRLAELFAETDEAEWLAEAATLVRRWFTLEDPTRLEPAGREVTVEHRMDGGLLLRGIIDRLDRAPSGALRVVDYKTGRAPREAFEAKALFQMKFYALVLWRSRGASPIRVQLTYLASGELVSLDVDAEQLERFERQLVSLWAAIERAAQTGDWRPSPSRLCDWCDHKVRCPAWGNEAPEVPADAVARLLGAELPESELVDADA